MKLLRGIMKDPAATISIFIIIIIILAGIFAPMLSPNDPNKININFKFASASSSYPLGNDYLGRCTLSRILYGIRPSVLFVIVTMIATVGIGIITGTVAGYFGGLVDEFLMRVCDIMLSFPYEAMVLASVGIFGTGLLKILLTIVFLRWAWYARVFRSAVMKYNKKNYIQFAKAMGNSHMYIIRKHILPAIMPEIFVIASNNICTLILMISGFSFLGLGVQAPKPEWGMMLSEAKNVMLTHPEQLLPPGLAIVMVCVSFAFLGDSIRNITDVNYSSNSIRKNNAASMKRAGA